MKNETKKLKQKIIPQELPQRKQNSERKLPHDANARRRADVKLKAKELVNTYGLKPTHAHEVIARQLGFKTYNAFLASTI